MSNLNILIACEFSGVVREAFIKQGFSAVSCDLEPTEIPGPHYQGDVLDILDQGWDLMIAHPPCTHLATSGSRWFKYKQKEQEEALAFVRTLLDAPVKHIALENPVSIISSRICKPTQIIQPWQFGHEISKRTCLWLKNLPPLKPTNIVGKGKMQKLKSGKQIPEWYSNANKKDRAKIRSRTFEGIAEAMAVQWGEYVKFC